jgi:hypothetical protein
VRIVPLQQRFTTYKVARDGVPFYRADDDNPLINDLGIYILDKLCMFQNIQDCYKVTAETEIDVHVRQCTLIVDKTKIYRFSKELLAYIEMCVAFSPYYRQDDPRTAGAMDMHFRDSLQAYADIPYNNLHDYLARRLHAWYAKFKPSSAEVVGVGDAEVGEVVSVGGVDGETRRAKKARCSLILDNGSAAPAAPPRPPAPGSSGDEGASEGGGRRQSGAISSLERVDLA